MTDRVRERIPDFGGVSRKGTVAMLFTVEAWNAEKSGVVGRAEGSGRGVCVKEV